MKRRGAKDARARPYTVAVILHFSKHNKVLFTQSIGFRKTAFKVGHRGFGTMKFKNGIAKVACR